MGAELLPRVIFQRKMISDSPTGLRLDQILAVAVFDILPLSAFSSAHSKNSPLVGIGPKSSTPTCTAAAPYFVLFVNMPMNAQTSGHCMCVYRSLSLSFFLFSFLFCFVE